MHLVFMDESGDISFSDSSDSKFFIITCLSIPEHNKHKLKNKIKQKKKKLFNLGWRRDIEPKASLLHSLNHNKKISEKVRVSINGNNFITEIIESVLNACNPRLDYFAVDKTKITDESFRNAPYGVAYNFFSAKLLCPIVLSLKKCKIYPDPRNKETKPKLKFSEYLQRDIIWESRMKNIQTDFSIHHIPSHTHYGLLSVDYFSWSIHRAIVYGESEFYDKFKNKIVEQIRWYC